MKKELLFELGKLAFAVFVFIAVCVGSYFLITGAVEVLF